MKMSRFLIKSCEILKEKKFSITERDSFERNADFYELLSKIDKNITVDELSKCLEYHGYCPSDLSEKFDCKSGKYVKEECICCWRDYLNNQLKPFKQLSFYSVLYKNRIEFIELVKSDDYKNWIYDYFANGGIHIDSESILYSDDKTNKEFGKHLSLFMMYISDLIEETDLKNLANHDEYESESYNFKIKDKFFNICLIFGQGSLISINELKDENIPLEFLEL